MEWSEEISAGFPQHNEAEPPTLREQIEAEISDHLNCAYQREILKTKDETSAIKAVLKQFGSPSKLARQLWLEQMKGRIMMQRSVLGLMATMAVGLFVLLFQNYQNNANQQSMLAQNAELILAIQQNSQPAVERWDPVVVKLNDEFGFLSDDEKVSGFKVQIKNNTFTATEKIQQSDAADFGPLAFGTYILNVTTPWGEELEQGIVAGPRRNQFIEIDCPHKKYSENVVQLTIDEAFQAQLVENKLSFLVVAECDLPDDVLTRKVGNSKWKMSRVPRRFVEFVLGEPRHDDKVDRTRKLLPSGTKLNIMYVGVYDKSAKYKPDFLDKILGRKTYGKGEIESQYFQTPKGRSLKYKSKYSDHGMPKGFPFQLSYYPPPISELAVGQSLEMNSSKNPMKLQVHFPERFQSNVEQYLEKKKEPGYENYFTAGK